MSTASTRARSAARDKPQSLSLPMVGVGVAILLIVVGAVLASRRDEKLPTLYGRRRGSESSRSVNGTAVLADLYRHAGHRVATMGRFSPKAKEFQTIVWAPNDFQPPDKDHREFLEDWLKEGTGRTLVYIGRDYDAAIDYWNRTVKEAPSHLADEALHRQAEARASWEAERSMMPEFRYARWFTARRDEKPKQIDKLSGPWAEGIDAKQADIHVEGQLTIPTKADYEKSEEEYKAATKKTPAKSAGAPTISSPKKKASPSGPPAKAKPAGKGKVTLPLPVSPEPEKPPELLPKDDYQPLLSSADDVLAFRIVFPILDEDLEAEGSSQIIVLTNGCFVLNYPLVNHENRKLAAKLIAECGEPDKVVFIESEAGGPPVLDKEPSGGFPTPLELLKVWPLNALLLHLTVLGIVVCLARAPIFGRPRELPAESPADFGKHVAALGKLLAQGGDRNYAQARIAQYRQLAERRSGRSHLKSK